MTKNSNQGGPASKKKTTSSFALIASFYRGTKQHCSAWLFSNTFKLMRSPTSIPLSLSSKNCSTMITSRVSPDIRCHTQLKYHVHASSECTILTANASLLLLPRLWSVWSLVGLVVDTSGVQKNTWWDPKSSHMSMLISRLYTRILPRSGERLGKKGIAKTQRRTPQPGSRQHLSAFGHSKEFTGSSCASVHIAQIGRCFQNAYLMWIPRSSPVQARPSCCVTSPV